MAYDLAAILDLEMTVDLLIHAIEKEQEIAAWDMWIAKLPNMTKDNSKDFGEFLAELKAASKKPKASDKSYEEIEEEAMKVVMAYEKRCA